MVSLPKLSLWRLLVLVFVPSLLIFVLLHQFAGNASWMILIPSLGPFLFYWVWLYQTGNEVSTRLPEFSLTTFVVALTIYGLSMLSSVSQSVLVHDSPALVPNPSRWILLLGVAKLFLLPSSLVVGWCFSKGVKQLENKDCHVTCGSQIVPIFLIVCLPVINLIILHPRVRKII